jgi:hypothetical protein
VVGGLACARWQAPTSAELMLARSVDEVRTGEGWGYRPKLDGSRRGGPEAMRGDHASTGFGGADAWNRVDHRWASCASARRHQPPTIPSPTSPPAETPSRFCQAGVLSLTHRPAHGRSTTDQVGYQHRVRHVRSERDREIEGMVGQALDDLENTSASRCARRYAWSPNSHGNLAAATLTDHHRHGKLAPVSELMPARGRRTPDG